jgi:hypothetical protein
VPFITVWWREFDDIPHLSRPWRAKQAHRDFVGYQQKYTGHAPASLIGKK